MPPSCPLDSRVCPHRKISRSLAPPPGYLIPGAPSSPLSNPHLIPLLRNSQGFSRALPPASKSLPHSGLLKPGQFPLQSSFSPTLLRIFSTPARPASTAALAQPSLHSSLPALLSSLPPSWGPCDHLPHGTVFLLPPTKFSFL